MKNVRWMFGNIRNNSQNLSKVIPYNVDCEAEYIDWKFLVFWAVETIVSEYDYFWKRIYFYFSIHSYGKVLFVLSNYYVVFEVCTQILWGTKQKQLEKKKSMPIIK